MKSGEKVLKMYYRKLKKPGYNYELNHKKSYYTKI